MRELSEQDKNELKCRVNIILRYSDCDDVRKRFGVLTKYLQQKYLGVNISRVQGFGPCLELRCYGIVSLAEAESILSKDNEYVLPLKIRYSDSKFTLTNDS